MRVHSMARLRNGIKRRFTETMLGVRVALAASSNAFTSISEAPSGFSTMQFDAELRNSLHRNNRNAAIELLSGQHFIDVTVGAHESVLVTEGLRSLCFQIACGGQFNLGMVRGFIPGQRNGMSALRMLAATN